MTAPHAPAHGCDEGGEAPCFAHLIDDAGPIPGGPANSRDEGPAPGGRREGPGSRVAVVTGGSAGVGRAVVREFATRGWDVAVLARGAAGLAGAVADVEARGRRGLAVAVDVADFEAVDDAAAVVEAELGPIDCWVNNAMTTTFARITDLEPEEIRRTTDVTYHGQVHGTLAALRRMRERDRGTIVFVGSALAFRGIPLQAAYCAAKFAARGFYESLRTELVEEGSSVKVTIVHLPAVNTPQFGWCRSKLARHPRPVAPIYEPAFIAQAIVDAAERAPRQRIVGSWNRLVVKAAQLMPGVADHFMARSGVDGQLTGIPITAHRRDDLFSPVDDDCDHGADGIFTDEGFGAHSPAFLRTLPEQGSLLVRSVAARLVEVRNGRRRRTRANVADDTHRSVASHVSVAPGGQHGQHG